MQWRAAEASDLSRLASWNRQLQEDEGATLMSHEGSAAFRLLTEEIVPERRLVLEVLASNPGGRAFWQYLGLEEWYTTYRRLPSRGSSGAAARKR